MPPKRTIFTDPNVILRALYREELARLADAESKRVERRESERKSLAANWAEPPVVIAEGRKPYHYYRDNFDSLAAVITDHELDGPGDPKTLADIDPWQAYNLVHLVGRQISDSERIRWQQQIRQMRAEGLVETRPGTRPTEICLADAGVQQAAELVNRTADSATTATATAANEHGR